MFEIKPESWQLSCRSIFTGGFNSRIKNANGSENLKPLWQNHGLVMQIVIAVDMIRRRWAQQIRLFEGLGFYRHWVNLISIAFM
jgi:hypothetical protein